jgi:hypothetical protein
VFNDSTENGVATSNTAVGNSALQSNVDANDNTALGDSALTNNDSAGHAVASGNTAVGSFALQNNVDGASNTAVGSAALSSNTVNDGNTAVGFHALLNATGASNTAIGAGALSNNISGNGNIVLGSAAGNVLHTGSGNIEIGNSGATNDEHDTIRIGFLQTRAFIQGIRDVTTGQSNAVPVVIDSVGQLGTMSSSLRFKKKIKPMDIASESILALKPVTFHYKSDKTNTAQFGLIAEDVARVNPDLIVRDKDGEIYTVRYDAVNAMLLNEFLKEHRKVEQQEASIVLLEKQVEALTAGLQKVNAQLAAGGLSLADSR